VHKPPSARTKSTQAKSKAKAKAKAATPTPTPVVPTIAEVFDAINPLSSSSSSAKTSSTKSKCRDSKMYSKCKTDECRDDYRRRCAARTGCTMSVGPKRFYCHEGYGGVRTKSAKGKSPSPSPKLLPKPPSPSPNAAFSMTEYLSPSIAPAPPANAKPTKKAACADRVMFSKCRTDACRDAYKKRCNARPGCGLTVTAKSTYCRKSQKK
jgi:hypothetical protein